MSKVMEEMGAVIDWEWDGGGRDREGKEMEVRSWCGRYVEERDEEGREREGPRCAGSRDSARRNSNIHSRNEQNHLLVPPFSRCQLSCSRHRSVPWTP